MGHAGGGKSHFPRPPDHHPERPGMAFLDENESMLECRHHFLGETFDRLEDFAEGLVGWDFDYDVVAALVYGRLKKRCLTRPPPPDSRHPNPGTATARCRGFWLCNVTRWLHYYQ